jgi:uncharacterized membrane protein YeiH
MTTLIKYDPRKLLLVADLAGTFVFGIEGATAAVYGNLDFLGLMVLAFATALAGGIFRDLLIGAVPPASLRDWRYPATAFLGAIVVFFLHRFISGVPGPLMIGLDAMGLALFAVAGTEKALGYKLSPFIAVLLGTVTAVGGGTVRDIFLAQVPRVLRTDIYATAALTGAAVMVISRKLKVPPTLSAILGGSFCFLLRIVSVWQHWNLPKVGTP